MNEELFCVGWIESVENSTETIPHVCPLSSSNITVGSKAFSERHLRCWYCDDLLNEHAFYASNEYNSDENDQIVNSTSDATHSSGFVSSIFAMRAQTGASFLSSFDSENLASTEIVEVNAAASTSSLVLSNTVSSFELNPTTPIPGDVISFTSADDVTPCSRMDVENMVSLMNPITPDSTFENVTCASTDAIINFDNMASGLAPTAPNSTVEYVAGTRSEPVALSSAMNLNSMASVMAFTPSTLTDEGVYADRESSSKSGADADLCKCFVPGCKELISSVCEELVCYICVPVGNIDKRFCIDHASHGGEDGHQKHFLCLFFGCTRPMASACKECPKYYGEVAYGFCELHIAHLTHAAEIAIVHSDMPTKRPDTAIAEIVKASAPPLVEFETHFLKDAKYVRYEMNNSMRNFVLVGSDVMANKTGGINRYCLIPPDAANAAEHIPNVLSYFWWYSWQVYVNHNRYGYEWHTRTIYSTHANSADVKMSGTDVNCFFLYNIHESRCSNPVYAWLVVYPGVQAGQWTIELLENVHKSPKDKDGHHSHRLYHRHPHLFYADDQNVSRPLHLKPI